MGIRLRVPIPATTSRFSTHQRQLFLAGIARRFAKKRRRRTTGNWDSQGINRSCAMRTPELSLIMTDRLGCYGAVEWQVMWSMPCVSSGLCPRSITVEVNTHPPVNNTHLNNEFIPLINLWRARVRQADKTSLCSRRVRADFSVEFL